MTSFNSLIPLLESYGSILIVSSLLMVFYLIVMSRKQSFRFQRMYLLSIPAICLLQIAALVVLPEILPQTEVETITLTQEEAMLYQSENPEAKVITEDILPLEAEDISVPTTTQEEAAESFTISANAILKCIYIGIPMVSALLLLVILIPLAQLLIRTSAIRRSNTDDPYLIIQESWVSTPFSMGRIIFLPTGSSKEAEEIFIKHEKAHIQSRHYIDVWCIEVMVRLLWFNPILWMVRKMVRDLHEFEADYKVLSQGVDIHQYQCLLIQEATENTIVISNGFNKSFIRQRLQQMKFKDGNTLNQVSQKLAVLLMIVLTGGITVLAMPERSIIVIPTGVDTDTIHTDRTQLPPTIQNNLAAVDSTIKSVQEDQNNLAVVEDSKASSDNVNEAKKLQQTKYIAATLNQENGTIDIHNVMEVPDSLAHIVERLSSKYIQYDTIPQFRLPHLKQAALNYDSLDYNTFAIYTNAHTVSPQEHADMLHRIAIWCTKKATYLAIVDKQNWPKRYFHTSPTEYLRDSKRAHPQSSKENQGGG